MTMILVFLFTGVSYAAVHEEYFEINSGEFSSEKVNEVIDNIAITLDNSLERKNILEAYQFESMDVDRDVFLYKLLSVSGYNSYIEDVLDDAKGLNLIDDDIYETLKNSKVISNEMYKKIMDRYLYFDLNDKEKNIIYYIVNKGYLDSSQVLLDGGMIVGDSNPNQYFKSDYFYMKLSSKDILKDYYLGFSKEDLLMDRSSYYFKPHVSEEKFYDIDFFLMDRKSNEYSNLTNEMKVEFDSDIYRYYPSKKRFWVYESEDDRSSATMNIKYREENMKLLITRELETFIMIDHDQDLLEPCSYYLIQDKYLDKEEEKDILTNSKSYMKSYIGIKYRDDKNSTIPIYFNKPGSSNYFYEAESQDYKYNKKIFIYDKDDKPFKGYLYIDIKDRYGKSFASKSRIKADGLVNIIFYGNKFNRIMDVYVEDMNGKKVSDVYSINSKSNDKTIIKIKQE
jgi:hypothetical protein